MSQWTGRMTGDESLVKGMSRKNNQYDDDFYLKVFVYLQSIAIIALSLALWFLVIDVDHEIKDMRMTSDRNTESLIDMRRTLAEQRDAQDQWQSQALARIQKAMETGAW